MSRLIWYCSLGTRSLIEYMTSGDCMALVLGRYHTTRMMLLTKTWSRFQRLNQLRPDGIDHWRRLIGPTRFWWRFQQTWSSPKILLGISVTKQSLFNHDLLSIQGFLKQGRPRQKVFAHSLVILTMTQGSLAKVSKYDELSFVLEHNLMDSLLE